MYEPTYGDISPRIIAQEAIRSTVVPIGQPADVEDPPEVLDPLLYCTGRCHANSPCPLRDMHTEDEVDNECCANYEGQVIDSMIGEAEYKSRSLISWRRWSDGVDTRLYRESHDHSNYAVISGGDTNEVPKKTIEALASQAHQKLQESMLKAIGPWAYTKPVPEEDQGTGGKVDSMA
jgi:hypothetical protein